MDIHESWRPVFRQVIVRALCDALGFTNLPHERGEHKRTVNIARAWFIEGKEDFLTLCELAELDHVHIRRVTMNLIHAKSTGDYTHIPEFWRHVFKGRRVPNLTNIERAIANLDEAA